MISLEVDDACCSAIRSTMHNRSQLSAANFVETVHSFARATVPRESPQNLRFPQFAPFAVVFLVRQVPRINHQALHGLQDTS